MVLSSLFAALTAICAWIAIPLPGISFTMQTFAVLLTLGVLGGRWGTVSISLYLLLGLVGLPVFTGFRGGVAALLDPTGGFLWGFFLGSLAYWALERLGRIPAMVGCLALTYLCGSAWFSVYAGMDFFSAMAVTVLPWLIPDALKLALANYAVRRITKSLRITN